MFGFLLDGNDERRIWEDDRGLSRSGYTKEGVFGLLLSWWSEKPLHLWWIYLVVNEEEGRGVVFIW